MVGEINDSELWEVGGLGSRGSELSLRPDEEGTSIGRQEVEDGGEEPPRLVAKGGLAGLQGTKGGGELPVEGSDTELRSSRSVTDTDSSPGLKNERRENESERGMRHIQGKSQTRSQVYVRELRDRVRKL